MKTLGIFYHGDNVEELVNIGNGDCASGVVTAH